MSAFTDHRNRFILVLGPWGSGTTAVTGVMERLGAYTCPPHFNTNDPRTPCAYEPLYLRQILLHYIDETSIRIKGDRRTFPENVRRWLQYSFTTDAVSHRVVAIKHPLLPLVLDDLFALLSPGLIVVHRPLEAIEASRLRRGWPSIYGREGAQILYRHTESVLNSLSTSSALDVLRLDYPQLLKHPGEHIARLADFAGLDDPTALETARAFIRG